jgi:adenosylcobinamide-phosphate synthase
MLLYPDALLVLLLALTLDPLLGELRWLWRLVPHPVAIVGGATAWLDRRLNRAERSDRARLMRGIFAAALLVLAAAAMGALIAWWLRQFYRFGWAIEGVMVALLLAQRSLFAHVARVATALTESLDAGRAAVAHIVGRDPASLDAHGVTRAAIESLAENFSDGVVAPALWYALFGLPGLFLYKTANTLDSMIGHRSPRHLRFGWAAARLDDLLNIVPARLAGLLIALAALTLPAASGGAALRTMLRDAKKHRSPNAGWPEAAAAGALGLALAGPRRYEGRVVDDPWLGDGRARATVADIAQALRLYVVACLALALIVLAALVLSYLL